MKSSLLAVFSIALILGAVTPAEPACCYFSALEKDVNQPGQKAFLTWDPETQTESFTVQPIFEGNAADFPRVLGIFTPKLLQGFIGIEQGVFRCDFNSHATNTGPTGFTYVCLKKQANRFVD